MPDSRWRRLKAALGLAAVRFGMSLLSPEGVEVRMAGRPACRKSGNPIPQPEPERHEFGGTARPESCRCGEAGAAWGDSLASDWAAAVPASSEEVWQAYARFCHSLRGDISVAEAPDLTGPDRSSRPSRSAFFRLLDRLSRGWPWRRSEGEQ